MSLPRPIFPGQLYLVTRRVSERRFFLKPSRRLNQAVEYIIAMVAQRTGVKVHAVCALSNHVHVVASDPEGRMPDFLRDVHSLIGKHVNSSLGRWENMWASEQTSLVRASGDDDVTARIVYTMANPVDAGLVAHGRSWPGLRTCWPAHRRATKRPVGFFREDGPTPATATLYLERPPGFDDLEDDELAKQLHQSVEDREASLRKQAAENSRQFLGRRAVLDQSPYASPRTREPRREISPRVAAKNKWRRIEALQRLENFVRQYRRAFALWRSGFVEVEFPAGTYLLQVMAGVRTALG